jgi:putative FmdB family regulatory protein
MPIYEYSCQECDDDFEELVRGEEVPVCPSCGTENIERQMSLPRVHSQSTKALSMRAAKKRDAGQAKDRMHDRLHYEESHDRHG